MSDKERKSESISFKTIFGGSGTGSDNFASCRSLEKRFESKL